MAKKVFANCIGSLLKQGGLLLAGAALLAGPLYANPVEKNVFGWIEMITLPPEHVEAKAKLDSGALTSSIHARNIERFEKKGDEWVRFEMDLKGMVDEDGSGAIFERPVYRNVIIRGAGGEERRPIVLMNICIGDQVYEEQFSLEDRSDMIYPILIGRRTIQHLGLIDVTQTFQQKPDCSDGSVVLRQSERTTNGSIGAGG